MAAEFQIPNTNQVDYYRWGSYKSRPKRSPQRLSYSGGFDFQFMFEGQVFVADRASGNQALQFQYKAETLTFSAINRFSTIPEVEKVYRTLDEERVYFYIFTSNRVYDYELMKRLIQVEIDLSKQYPDLPQSYRYTASVLVEDDRYITESDDPPIYPR